MRYFSDVELSRALLWLTTSRLDEGPFELLAVVLDDSSDTTFLETVNRAQPQVDPISDHVLVMSLSRHASAPWTPDMAERSRAASDWLKGLFSVIRQERADEPRCDHLDAVLELLGLTRRVLPAIYLRARGALPIIATPNGPAQAIQILKVLSGAFQGPGTYTAPVQAYLQTLGVTGFEVKPETQNALDWALVERRTGLRRTGMHKGGQSDEAAEEWSRITAMIERMWRPVTPSASFRWAKLVRTVGNGLLLEREHRSAIETAVWAHEHHDWGTVVRNIAAVIEASLATAFAQLARSRAGHPEVRLPSFYNLWDPLARDVLIGRNDLNSRRAGVVAEGPGARIPWQPPTLKPAIDVFIHVARQPEAPVEATSAQLGALQDIANEVVALRNPAAHGDHRIGTADAEKAWALLDRWVEFGYASWAFQIRDRLLSGRWPPASAADRPQLRDLASFRGAQQTVQDWERENLLYLEERRRSQSPKREHQYLQFVMDHLIAFTDSLQDLAAHRRLSRALRERWLYRTEIRSTRAELVVSVRRIHAAADARRALVEQLRSAAVRSGLTQTPDVVTLLYILGEDRTRMINCVEAWRRLGLQLAHLRDSGRSKRAIGPHLQGLFERALALEQAHDAHVELWTAEVKRRVEAARMEISLLLEAIQLERVNVQDALNVFNSRQECLRTMSRQIECFVPANCRCGAHRNIPYD